MNFNSINDPIVNFLVKPTPRVPALANIVHSFASSFLPGVGNSEPPPLASPADLPPPPPAKPLVQEPQRKVSTVLAQPIPVLEGFHAMEAYFSWDGKWIIFQGAENPGYENPLQVYTWQFKNPGEKFEAPKRWTSTTSNCECTFFSSDGRYIVFNTKPKNSASEKLDFGGYPYHYDPGKEVFLGRLLKSGLTTERLTKNDAYEAETSFSPVFQGHPGYPKDGVYLLFTSSRSGSLDLYIRRILDRRGKRLELDPDGHTEVPLVDSAIQITNTPTLQEGGAFFLPDGRIVYRAWEFDPKNPQKEKWERNRVNYRPMQIYIYDPVTKEHKQLTHGNARHWAPFPHPDGDKIVFAKRDFSETNHNFDIFVLHLKDGRQERITQDPHFDGYPVFHPNGDLILFSRYLRDKRRFQLMQVPYKE